LEFEQEYLVNRLSKELAQVRSGGGGGGGGGSSNRANQVEKV